MNDQLRDRLHDLRAEFESGRQQMKTLDLRRENLERTLLRISGAIQVLEEVLGSEQAESGQEARASNGTPQTVGT
jgi:hypothetical protein